MQRVIEVAIALVSRLVSHLYSQIVLVLRVLLRKSGVNADIFRLGVISPNIYNITHSTLYCECPNDYVVHQTLSFLQNWRPKSAKSEKKKMAVWTPDKIANFFWVRPTTVLDKVDQVLSGQKKKPPTVGIRHFQGRTPP